MLLVYSRLWILSPAANSFGILVEMPETLLSLDENKRVSREEAPLPKAGRPELRSLGITVVAILFLLAFVFLVWIVIALVRPDSGLDAVLPFLTGAANSENLNF